MIIKNYFHLEKLMFLCRLVQEMFNLAENWKVGVFKELRKRWLENVS